MYVCSSGGEKGREQIRSLAGIAGWVGDLTKVRRDLQLEDLPPLPA